MNLSEHASPRPIFFYWFEQKPLPNPTLLVFDMLLYANFPGSHPRLADIFLSVCRDPFNLI